AGPRAVAPDPRRRRLGPGTRRLPGGQARAQGRVVEGQGADLIARAAGGDSGARRAQRYGTTAWSVVPPPGGLLIHSSPSSAAIRSDRPASPVPVTVGAAPPIPSSAISIVNRPLSSAIRTRISPAAACFTAFVRASETKK